MSKPYALTAGDFQRGDVRSLKEMKAEVTRLDLETDSQFRQRIEITIAMMKEQARNEFDAPVFRTIVTHCLTRATINVDVIYGEEREP